MYKIAFVAITLASGAASAQPFGIAMGTPVSALNVIKTLDDHTFIVKPPKPHPAFESAVVVATPLHGVCVVRGAGHTINGDAYGEAVRRTFGEVREQIDSVYGRSGLNDRLNYGSIWHEPNEWTMAVKQNERSYQAYWDSEAGSKLSHGITEILLTTRALSMDDDYILLQVTYSNSPACDAEIGSASAKAF